MEACPWRRIQTATCLLDVLRVCRHGRAVTLARFFSPRSRDHEHVLPWQSRSYVYSCNRVICAYSRHRRICVGAHVLQVSRVTGAMGVELGAVCNAFPRAAPDYFLLPQSIQIFVYRCSFLSTENVQRSTLRTQRLDSSIVQSWHAVSSLLLAFRNRRSSPFWQTLCLAKFLKSKSEVKEKK